MKPENALKHILTITPELKIFQKHVLLTKVLPLECWLVFKNRGSSCDRKFLT